MTKRHLFPALLLAMPLAASPAAAESPGNLSGPFNHGNLTIYLVHGDPAPGMAGRLVTLQEALAKGLVRVHETGNVRRLKIENLSKRPVYLQAGDILKGGRQDRVITSDLVLPAKPGLVSIGAYCVERGRWAKRKGESQKRFSSAKTALPHRKLKLALLAEARPPRRSGPSRIEGPRPSQQRQVQRLRQRQIGRPSNQSQVWREVDKLQKKLSRNAAADVRSRKSRTSLQLSLENKALRAAVAKYVAALSAAPTKAAGRKPVVGVVVVINGKITGADVYAHPALFTRLWPKLLRAAATEALSEKDAKKQQQPRTGDVAAFLAEARTAGKEKNLRRGSLTIHQRRGKKAVFSESRTGKKQWIHRSIVVY